jgi:predicted N-acetyltransferase YhbS
MILKKIYSFKTLFSRRSHQGSKETAIKDFFGNPEASFFGSQKSPYSWDLLRSFGEISPLPDIFIRSANQPIGYVQNIQLELQHGIGWIGHIACETGFEGHGIGRKMVETLIKSLRETHGVTTLVFAENSTRYQSAGYPAFFKHIGAEEWIEPRGVRSTWIWGEKIDLSEITSLRKYKLVQPMLDE